jgi:choice-of-anchor A domain-containing protein
MQIRTCASTAALAATLVGFVGFAHAGAVNDWNLIVLNNLANSSQDIEGRAFVGGNFTGGSPTVAKNLTPASNWLGVTNLAVVGNVSVQNLNMQSGNLRHGGTFSGNFNANGGGNRAQINTLGAQRTAIAGELTSLSSFLRTLTPNSTATFPSSQPSAVRYTASGSGLAVFNVSAANVFNSSLIQQIELNAGSATSIVINVSGTTVNFTNGNMVGAWTSSFARSKVIWNFWEATSMFFDRNFNGAVLAPNAHLRNTTAIDGSVFVSSMQQDGEVHLPNYTGFVPTPGSLALLGAAGLIATRRRR